ncbi:MAG: SDR family NAD(P)-dependent oxidoreductase [Blastocatellia bacterium]|nr:SDR family NAD(P)-dependent oxidoreductase [Blastocatellia bacterium]
MKISKNTILITGGATGIGLALAKQFIAQNNTVIVCSRRQEKLNEAKAVLPSLVIIQCDISSVEQRRELFKTCVEKYPTVNILINNAGIQREIDFRKGEIEYLNGESETETNWKLLSINCIVYATLMKQKKVQL